MLFEFNLALIFEIVFNPLPICFLSRKTISHAVIDLYETASVRKGLIHDEPKGFARPLHFDYLFHLGYFQIQRTHILWLWKKLVYRRRLFLIMDFYFRSWWFWYNLIWAWVLMHVLFFLVFLFFLVIVLIIIFLLLFVIRLLWKLNDGKLDAKALLVVQRVSDQIIIIYVVEINSSFLIKQNVCMIAHYSMSFMSIQFKNLVVVKFIPCFLILGNGGVMSSIQGTCVQHDRE